MAVFIGYRVSLFIVVVVVVAVVVVVGGGGGLSFQILNPRGRTSRITRLFPCLKEIKSNILEIRRNLMSPHWIWWMLLRQTNAANPTKKRSGFFVCFFFVWFFFFFACRGSDVSVSLFRFFFRFWSASPAFLATFRWLLFCSFVCLFFFLPT